MNLRRFLFILFVIALAPPGFAQSLAKTFTLSAANQNACIGTNNLPTIGIDLTGTASLTLQPQVSINGSSPKTSSVTSTVAGSSAQATIVLSGATAASYVAAVGGFDTFCLNVSSYSSGKIVVVLNPSSALNASLLGGGGGGTATGLAANGATVSLAGGDIAETPAPGQAWTAETLGVGSFFVLAANGTEVLEGDQGVGIAGTDDFSDEWAIQSSGTFGSPGSIFDLQNCGSIVPPGFCLSDGAGTEYVAGGSGVLDLGGTAISLNGAVTIPSGGSLSIPSGASFTCATGSTCKAPTQSSGTNNTSIASTAFVAAAVAAPVVGTVNCTQATCATSATSIVASAGVGLYQFAAAFTCTAVASSSLVLTVAWTSSGNAASVSTVSLPCTTFNDSQLIHYLLVDNATAIQYSMTQTNSPVFKLEIVVTQMSSS